MCDTVDFSAFCVVYTGNLCFGKCGVKHYGLWAVQTLNFLHTQHKIFRIIVHAASGVKCQHIADSAFFDKPVNLAKQ